MPRKLNKSWILAYSEAIQKISEAPTQYNIWAAISVVASVLKNNLWIKYGPITVKPNMYIVLTGPPGIGKGSAMHPAYDFPKRLKLINDISDRVTAPKIAQRLAQGTPTVKLVNGVLTQGVDSTATLISAELPSLISASDWMLPFLCDLWDRGDFQYDTKNSGTAKIEGLCVSLIGGCVPDYIRKLNRDVSAAINGGFTARTIFVFAESKAQNLVWPKSLEDSEGALFIKNLEDELIHLATLKGEVRLDQNAFQRFTVFKQNIYTKEDDSDVVAHFKSRLHIHVLKLAMVFAATNSDKLIITEFDIKNAELLCNQVLSNLDRVFRGVGESVLAEATSKVQNFIEKKGVTSRTDILKNLHRHVSPEDLDRILVLLQSIGFFTYKSQGNKSLIFHTNKSKAVNTTTQSIT